MGPLSTNIRIGELIRRQREAVGMAVTRLAKEIGVNRNTIANYETGRTMPSVADLVRLAAALGCTLTDLAGDAADHGVVRFAFRAHKKLGESPDVRVAARKFLRAYREIEAIMDARLDVRLPDESFDPADVAPQRWTPTAAARCRDLVGVRSFGPERIALLLEALGVRTLFFAFGGKGLDGISAIEAGMSFLMLHRREKAVERTIFSAAHELGHLVLHPALFTSEAPTDSDNGRDYEREANLFAGHFLVPTDSLVETWKDERLGHLPLEHALLLLKRTFHVSYWLLYRRVADEGLTLVQYAELVARTKRLLGIAGPAKMEDLEPSPMATKAIERSTRFQSLIRSAFVQDKIGVAKVAELLQATVDQAKAWTFEWTNPEHELVGECDREPKTGKHVARKFPDLGESSDFPP